MGLRLIIGNKQRAGAGLDIADLFPQRKGRCSRKITEWTTIDHRKQDIQVYWSGRSWAGLCGARSLRSEGERISLHVTLSNTHREPIGLQVCRLCHVLKGRCAI